MTKNPIAKDLRTPKYKKRVKPDKKKQERRNKAKKKPEVRE